MKDDQGNDVINWIWDSLGRWSDDELERLLQDAASRECEAKKDWKAVRGEQILRERR